ncbi:T9SS type A sorting domain-containing protein [bacterium]|nr:T9SS type A sorting domain-containing protein [bacterium]
MDAILKFEGGMMRKWLILFILLIPAITIGEGRFPVDQGVIWLGDYQLPYHVDDLSGSVDVHYGRDDHTYYLPTPYALYKVDYENENMGYSLMGIIPFYRNGLYTDHLIMCGGVNDLFFLNEDSTILLQSTISPFTPYRILAMYGNNNFIMTNASHDNESWSEFWDIHNPYNPERLYVWPKAGKSTRIVDDYFYTHTDPRRDEHEELHVFQAVDPAAPELVNSIPIQGYMADVLPGWLMTVDNYYNDGGNWAYLFYSLEDPENPVLQHEIVVEALVVRYGAATIFDSLFVTVMDDFREDSVYVNYFDPYSDAGHPEMISSHSLAVNGEYDPFSSLEIARDICWVNPGEVVELNDIDAPRVIEVDTPLASDTTYRLDCFIRDGYFTSKRRDPRGYYDVFFCKVSGEPGDITVIQEIPDDVLGHYFGNLLTVPYPTYVRIYNMLERVGINQLEEVAVVPYRDIGNQGIHQVSLNGNELTIVTLENIPDSLLYEYRTYRVRNGESRLTGVSRYPHGNINVWEKNHAEEGMLLSIGDTLYYTTVGDGIVLRDSLVFDSTARVDAAIYSHKDRNGIERIQVYIDDHRIYDIVNNQFHLAHDLRGLTTDPEEHSGDVLVCFSPEYAVLRVNHATPEIYRAYRLDGENSDSIATFYPTGRRPEGAVLLGDTLIIRERSCFAYFLLEGGYNDVSIDRDANKDLPNRYNLDIPYPNPFNSKTQIQFDLPLRSHVRVALYDILGREAIRIVDQHLEAGRHTRTLNASNMASGIYFVSIKAGNFVDQKKIVLLK